MIISRKLRVGIILVVMIIFVFYILNKNNISLNSLVNKDGFYTGLTDTNEGGSTGSGGGNDILFREFNSTGNVVGSSASQGSIPKILSLYRTYNSNNDTIGITLKKNNRNQEIDTLPLFHRNTNCIIWNIDNIYSICSSFAEEYDNILNDTNSLTLNSFVRAQTEDFRMDMYT